MQHIPSQTLNTVLEEALCKVHGFGCPTSKDFLRPWVGYWKVQKKKFNFLKRKRIVPRVIYCLRYCFLLTKDCTHNEVWGCVETLPRDHLNFIWEGFIYS